MVLLLFNIDGIVAREIFSWRGCHSSSQLELMEVGSGSEFLEVHGPHGLLPGQFPK